MVKWLKKQSRQRQKKSERRGELLNDLVERFSADVRCKEILLVERGSLIGFGRDTHGRCRLCYMSVLQMVDSSEYKAPYFNGARSNVSAKPLVVCYV
jgi:hypothetical protein